jgi:hypothetical protein
MLEAGRSRFWFPTRSFDFSIYLIFSAAIWSWVRLTLWQKWVPEIFGRPTRKADNLTAICEPIVYKMWEPRRLTTLWASTACYRDSFTFIFTSLIIKVLTIFKMNSCVYTYCHVHEWLQAGFGWVIGFIEHLLIINTSNYSAIANPHTLQFTTEPT